MQGTVKPMNKIPVDVRLELLSFEALSIQQLYELLRLRSEVFVLEQQCLYQDMDGLDQQAKHLMVTDDQQRLCAYARILPPGIAFAEPAIGRILTASCWRGQGYGQWFIKQAVACTQQLYSKKRIRIGAQAYLQRFYTACGFEVVGEPYDEDGILHIEMLL